MKLIDLHADTITALYYDMKNYQSEQEFIREQPFNSLSKNNLQLDIHKLKAADSLAQFFVLWLNLDKCHKHSISPWNHFLKLHKLLLSQLSINKDEIKLVSNLSGVEKISLLNKLSAFIAVEEGAFISNLDELEIAYSMGVRYITLVWNYETHIGVPSCIDQNRGLKSFGFEMAMRMQDLGMLVDVSHLSDKGVRDILDTAKKPIIASHSNAREICNHTRNLPDELIRGIATNGGVIGVGCVPNFLDEVNKTIKIDTMIRHLRHIYNIAGIDVLALGNDFDGYKCYTPESDEIKNIADIPLLADKLIKAGFTISEVEKIFYKNVKRILTIL
jgi:membrane dipeptidase